MRTHHVAGPMKPFVSSLPLRCRYIGNIILASMALMKVLSVELLLTEAFILKLPKNNQQPHTKIFTTATQRRRRLVVIQSPIDKQSMRCKRETADSDNNDLYYEGNKLKYLLPISALVSLSLVTLSAFWQILPGPPIDATAPQPPFLSTLPYGVIFSGSCEPYTPSLISRDLGSTILSFAAATAFVKLITYTTKLGKLDSRDARKIIHTFSAPLFMLVWPLFSNAYGARVFASIVPLLIAVRLVVAGTSKKGDSSLRMLPAGSIPVINIDNGLESDLAKAISRSGDAKEALQGPFIYVLVLLVSTLFFWVDTPIGVVSMATLAVGDGLADLIGRRLGASNKWPMNTNKSMTGSAAFVLGSVVASFGLISWLTWVGVMDPLHLDSLGLLARLVLIAVICAVVELIPLIDDNYSVPVTAAVLSSFLLN